MKQTMRRKLVAGNWKMYGSRSMASDLAGAIAARMPTDIDVAVFPPFPYITALSEQLAGTALQLGAQDVSEHEGQGAYTGEVSAAMLAEGLHSVADGSNNLLMLLGIRLSQRGPTEQHPLGYGMAVYFWSLVIAIVTFGVGGAVSIAEGIHNLLRPEALTRPLWNYVVLLVSFLADGWTLIIGYREFRAAGAGAGPAEAGIWTGIRDSKDPSRFIVILEDGAATIGVLIAVLTIRPTGLFGRVVVRRV